MPTGSENNGGTRRSGSTTKKNAFCSFCRKSYRDVGPLVEGPGDVYICGDCIELCQSILDQERRRRGTSKEIVTDGILVISVKTWPKNTRLFKELDKTGLQIDCNPPKPAELVKWLQHRAKSLNGLKLSSDAAREMIEIVGCEVGLLDQELEKMMLTVDPDTSPTPADIQKRIGGWRTKKVWDMLDAACDGNLADAMKQLERLIYSGEHPIAILGQIAFPLRKFALATSMYRSAEREQKKISLGTALERSGVQRFYLADTERRLKRLGRDRAAALYRWLLEADMAMKGDSSRADRARIVLEQLITRIAVPRSVPIETNPEMPGLSRSR